MTTSMVRRGDGEGRVALRHTAASHSFYGRSDIPQARDMVWRWNHGRKISQACGRVTQFCRHS